MFIVQIILKLFANWQLNLRQSNIFETHFFNWKCVYLSENGAQQPATFLSLFNSLHSNLLPIVVWDQEGQRRQLPLRAPGAVGSAPGPRDRSGTKEGILCR